MTKAGEARAFFENIVLPYEGDHCLVWPFACSNEGRGQLRDSGRMRSVHLMVCEAIKGPKPTADHQAAHSCGKGHLACITPRHLRWATRLENEADKLIHGTVAHGERHGHSRFSEQEAKEIIGLKGKMLQRDIAARFGVHLSTVSSIQRGKNWAHLSR